VLATLGPLVILRQFPEQLPLLALLRQQEACSPVPLALQLGPQRGLPRHQASAFRTAKAGLLGKTQSQVALFLVSGDHGGGHRPGRTQVRIGTTENSARGILAMAQTEIALTWHPLLVDIGVIARLQAWKLCASITCMIGH
jgi:hypothetical protein